MSTVAVAAVLSSHLERPLRFLATVLATYANAQGGSVFPSVATLAKDLACGERFVRQGLSRLRVLGVLQVESKMIVGPTGTLQPAGGRGRVTRYGSTWSGSPRWCPRTRPRANGVVGFRVFTRTIAAACGRSPRSRSTGAHSATTSSAHSPRTRSRCSSRRSGRPAARRRRETNSSKRSRRRSMGDQEGLPRSQPDRGRGAPQARAARQARSATGA